MRGQEIDGAPPAWIERREAQRRRAYVVFVSVMVSRPAGLSPREIEVLRLVARGLSSREIAEQLTLSTKTVRNHTERIYAKTGTGNRGAASLFALQHGLLPLE